MDTIETLIPDTEGNHLVVALYFYDESDKLNTLNIPEEFSNLDIADINIEKLNQDAPLGYRAFAEMVKWLVEKFLQFPNAVFSFIVSTDPLNTRHKEMTPAKVRWALFERLYERHSKELANHGVLTKSIIVGVDEFEADARVFYRTAHAPIIHLVEAHLNGKYH